MTFKCYRYILIYTTYLFKNAVSNNFPQIDILYAPCHRIMRYMNDMCLLKVHWYWEWFPDIYTKRIMWKNKLPISEYSALHVQQAVRRSWIILKWIWRQFYRLAQFTANIYMYPISLYYNSAQCSLYLLSIFPCSNKIACGNIQHYA